MNGETMRHEIVRAVCVGAMVLTVWLWSGFMLASAQEKPKPAEQATALALTDVQKLTIQNVLQRIELAQLRAQAAQRDFEQARTEAQTLIASLQVPGHTLDLQTMTYTKLPEKPPAPKPEKK